MRAVFAGCLLLAAFACGSAKLGPLSTDTNGGGLPSGKGSGGSGGSGGTAGGTGGSSGGGGSGATCGIHSGDCSNCVEQGCAEAKAVCYTDPTCAAAFTTFQDCACQAELASDVATLGRCEDAFNQSSATGAQFEVCVTVCQSCTK